MYCVSSNSINTNINIANIETDLDEEDEVGCTMEKEDHWATANTILKILLKNLKEFELFTWSSAIPENKLFTLTSNKMSLESLKCDDSGTYLSKGTVKKFDCWESSREEPPPSSPFNKLNQTWLIKKRTWSNCYDNVQVEQEKVYEIY